MDTNQTNAGQNQVGATIDATQAAEVGGGGACDAAGFFASAIQTYEDAIAATVYVAERITEAVKS